MVSFRYTPSTHRTYLLCNICGEDSTFCCGFSNTVFYDPNSAVQMGNGTVWHSYYVDRHAFCSDYSGQYWPLTERVAMGNGAYWGYSEVVSAAEQSFTGEWWPKHTLADQPDGRRLHPTEVGV